MSADYILFEPIEWSKIVGAEGIQEIVTDETSDHWKCITDGTNYVWCTVNEDGNVSNMSRYGGNDEDAIFEILTEAIEGFSAHYIG
jgi:hypothetical protein